MLAVAAVLLLTAAAAAAQTWNANGSHSCSIVADDTLTLFADAQYAVTFNARGGAPALTQDSVKHGSAVPRPADPTREEYTFEGWYADTISWGSAWDFDTPITSDTTLYAKWTTRLYTVRFNARGGSDVPPQFLPYGSLVSQPASPAYPKHNFEGWYANYASDAGWRFDSDRVTGDTTLHARWTLLELFVNIITPNDDGINDCLEISQGLLELPNELSVFNRAGYMVYYKKGYDNTFCGGKLSDNTYFYLFIYTDSEGKTHKIFNSLLITR
jgi:gliding motility-associated-like protein/uncharacterized repeat protein (TIGR02543 family)